MSKNLDLARSMFAAWEGGDLFSSIEWAHPEIDYVRADGPLPGSWTGVAELEKGFRGFLDAWEDVRFGVEGVPRARRRARPCTSPLQWARQDERTRAREMRTQGAILFHIRDGEVTRLVVYWDRERAFADLGLKE